MTAMIKVIIISIWINLMLCDYLQSQTPDKQIVIDSTNVDTISNTRNVIGFVPSKANKVNGWAIGWVMLNEKEKLKINGLYTNLSPFQLYWGPASCIFILLKIFGDNPLKITKNGTIYGDYIDIDTTKCNQVINGCTFSIVDDGYRTKINGIELSAVSQSTNQINGLAFSGLMNCKVKFNGLMSGLINISEKGNGLQIGLINNCGDLHGFQIGLFNRCGKRIIPFMNFRLKKRNN